METNLVRAVSSLMLALADDEIAALVHPDSVKRVRWFAAAMAKRIAYGSKEKRVSKPRDFVVPVCDAEVADLLLGSREAATAKVLAWRTLAEEMGRCGTPVAYRVRPGFALLTHAPLAGPCVGFHAVHRWGIQNDESTHDSIVFWVPGLVKETIGQAVGQQLKVLAQTRERLKLPAHHMEGLGSAALVSALMLAHHRSTGENVPVDGFSARTETKTGDGHNLRLRFVEDGLTCGRFWKRSMEAHCGCFALAVERGVK